jgi:hypothetical protein
MLSRSATRGSEPSGEVVLPFPTPLAECSEFRTTWLSSSLAAMKDLGLFEQYRSELPAPFHEPVLYSVAGAWGPVEVAVEHYAACDRLNLPYSQVVELSRAVTRRLHDTSLSTVVRLVKQSGATPWHAMLQLNRFWERVWRGGGVRVTKLGPKDAIIEFGGWPLATSAYVQKAMPAITEAVLSLFCKRVFAREAAEYYRHHVVAVHVSWV